MSGSVRLFFLFLFCLQKIYGQINCTFPGQTPISAVPVCGSEPLTVNTPTFCGTTAVPVACGSGFSYQNTNPTFFRMACFSSGTLGFLIRPDQATANFDWQLFDITGRNPYDIFTEPALFVAANWSPEPGETGASDDGSELLVCYGSGQAVFSKMPQILQGRTYLLMVANQGSAGNYQLTITGGSAGIADPVEPRMDHISVSCDGKRLLLRLNKKIDCSTVAADGSDFLLSNGIAVTAAIPGDCSSLFGSDSIFLTLAQALPPGQYSLLIKKGSDNNSLLDLCDKVIPEGQTLLFTAGTDPPVIPESVVTNGCRSETIRIRFSDDILCASVAADGSQFSITGPGPAGLSSAMPLNCNNLGLCREILLRFEFPLSAAGDYLVKLNAAGINGQLILDECGRPVMNAAEDRKFTITAPLSALFRYTADENCAGSTYRFIHTGSGQASQWYWQFGNKGNSTEPAPVFTFSESGNHLVRLIVSNSLCSDTAEQTLTGYSPVKSQFSTGGNICPGDTLAVVNESSGSIDFWKWDWGNNTGSDQFIPANVRFPAPATEQTILISLVAGNSRRGCYDTSRRTVQLLSSCIVSVPSAFTPNNDGLNDFLFPLNADKVTAPRFRVYNRSGQLVFASQSATGRWDGRINGELQETGIYAWLFSYTDRRSGKPVILKGTVLLIR